MGTAFISSVTATSLFFASKSKSITTVFPAERVIPFFNDVLYPLKEARILNVPTEEDVSIYFPSKSVIADEIFFPDWSSRSMLTNASTVLVVFFLTLPVTEQDWLLSLK